MANSLEVGGSTFESALLERGLNLLPEFNQSSKEKAVRKGLREIGSGSLTCVPYDLETVKRVIDAGHVENGSEMVSNIDILSRGGDENYLMGITRKGGMRLTVAHRLKRNDLIEKSRAEVQDELSKIHDHIRSIEKDLGRELTHQEMITIATSENFPNTKALINTVRQAHNNEPNIYQSPQQASKAESWGIDRIKESSPEDFDLSEILINSMSQNVRIMEPIK